MPVDVTEPGTVLFCVACGARTEAREIEGRPRPVCEACGRVTYVDPKLAVAVLVVRDDLVLLGKRGASTREPGKWSFPAGFVERGERVEVAAVREGREETGLDLTLGPLVGLFSCEGDPVVLAVYAVITQQDIGKLFMAGVLPGLLAMGMYVLTIVAIVALAPKLLPAGEKKPWSERLAAMKDVWPSLVLFIFVIGGLYGGVFTPTEAGGVGAGGAFLLGVIRRKLDRAGIRQALLQATRTAAAVFTVLIGALLFGYFLTITQTPQKLTEFLTGLGIGRYGVLALIMVMYLLLGCLMDAMAMIILTVPIIFPVIMQLGFDPIWFGVIIVMTVELGLIHPPVGMNVFVIKSVVQEVSFTTIFKGVIPFVLTDILRLLILIAFPAIALWLPGRM